MRRLTDFLLTRPMALTTMNSYKKVLMEKSTHFRSPAESRHRVGTGGGEMGKFFPELRG